MFLPCPNCGFLVALVKPKNSATEQRCPRCGQVLVPAATEPGHAGDEAPRTHSAAGVDVHAQRDPRATGAAGRNPAADAHRPASAAPHARHDAAGAAEPGAAAHRPPGPGVPATPAVPAAAPAPSPAAARSRHAPSFARRRQAAAPPRPWRLHAAAAALALVLALQLVLAQRDALAADVRWRPALETLCGALGCSVPAWREPAAFTMIDRSVQPKPGTSGVLTARASFRNDARWPQPWPTLVLTLSGLDGEPLGMRAFAPDEYAGGARAPLAPGQAANVQLDVVEPAPGVVAFAFDFR